MQLPGVMDPILEAIHGIVSECTRLFQEGIQDESFYKRLGVRFSFAVARIDSNELLP